MAGGKVYRDSASAPFDDASADLIIRTADNVNFLVHTTILVIASPVFATSVPQSPSPSTQQPFMRVAQSSHIWDKFLRLCYPVREPVLTLDDVGPLLKLAHEYGAECVTSRLRHILVDPKHLKKEPYRVYVLATFARQGDIACAAARSTLNHPITPPSFPELRLERGGALARLLQYRKRCVEVTAEVVQIKDDVIPGWITAESRDHCFFYYCDKGWKCWTTQRTLKWAGAVFGRSYISQYWITYMEGVLDALRERPDPSVARTPSMIHAAIETAAECKGCRKHVSKDLEAFIMDLQAELEGAIAQANQVRFNDFVSV
ncbi:hypothetical protein BN946_scf184850.g2 [Trametes cinnabarina]|uniref:BTB domain-containing protein n=1 Tax=Pycnoporus cinnabarinus TaxID=5643 RepID=A0A060SIY0_PYCCI|nr:hypothetical protein BN946_scf184850.g2 [Trametes cinnabarina]